MARYGFDAMNGMRYTPAMSQSLTSLTVDGPVATLTLDDGKRNALSPAMFDAIYAAIAEVEKADAALVITGREGVLSAGFDLKVMKKGGLQTVKMLRAGYNLTARLLAFPTPVVIASPGHVYAMGAFMLLSGDYRFGVPGPYTYVANEVALGMPMPRTAIEVMRLRLSPAARERAVVLSEEFSPEEALEAGFIDELVSVEQLLGAAQNKAAALLEKVDLEAHAMRLSDILCMSRRGFIEGYVLQVTGKLEQGTGGPPIGTAPFVECVSNGQIDELERGLFGRHVAACLEDFSDLSVEVFDGVGGVNHASDFLGKAQERSHLIPSRAPRFTHHRKSVTPNLFETL